MEIAELGARLRRRRLDLGRTLAWLAEKAEVSIPYVANLERGRGNPTIDVLRRIAAALDVPLGTLVGDVPGEDRDQVVELPRSLVDFSRSERFVREVERLAADQGVSIDEMRARVLSGMASAPRRASGQPTREDWARLLDTYILILRS